MPIVVEVSVRKTAEKYQCDPKSLSLAEGEEVLVNTDDGLESGRVIKEEHFFDNKGKDIRIRYVVRKITDEDRRILAENTGKAREAYRIILNKIDGKKLKMNLSCTEYIFDCGKLYVYYTAESRIDFRELIKELGHILKTRIQMVQIGVRDEARITGDCGPCGQELCCKKFISDFKPVTIDMVKDQNLLMNPGKLSGICGRLMCCMSFEVEAYRAMAKDFPKVGSSIKHENEEWSVKEVNFLSGDIVLKASDGRTKKINNKKSIG